jgi:hypothetical protein
MGLTNQQAMDLWATCLGVQVLIILFEDVEPTWAGMTSKSKGFLFRVVKRASPPNSTMQVIAQAAKALLESAALVVERALEESMDQDQ